MQYLRFVHPRNFDKNTGRFNDLTFKNSSNSGMSVVERGCAEALSGQLCRHARQFYATIAGEPPIFYILDESELPSGASLVRDPNDSGDPCHREVAGAGNNALYKAFRLKRAPEFFWICDGASARKLERADIERLAGA